MISMNTRNFRLFACLLVFSGSQLGAANETHTLLVFGDSLSAAYNMREEQGWVALLEEKMAQNDLPVAVVNGSVSGETTAGGLARLPAMLDSYSPDIVILQLGGNDGLRGLPLGQMRSNLACMIEEIQSSDATILLAGIQIPPNYGPRYTEPFFATFGGLAKEYDLALVPFLIDGIPQQPELMQPDGIHPRAAAQHMIIENVWPSLLTIIEKVVD